MITNTFFITSPGTGNGKTLITALITMQMIKKGYSTFALKPIISGWDSTQLSDMDTSILLQSLGIKVAEENWRLLSPWRYNSPVSPDIAANREGRAIYLDEVVNYIDSFRCQNPDYEYLFIEGAGGVMTPINGSSTMIDLMSAINVSAILVTGVYLGAIGHTLCCLEALHSRGVHVKAIIVNEEQPAGDTKVIEMIESIASHTQGIPIYHVPHIDVSDLANSAPDLSSIFMT